MKIIEVKTSTIDGAGCFAMRKIEKATPVIEYVGEKISKAESLRRCEQYNYYIFALDEEFDLDGNVGWNPAKFINHSCAPNGEAQWIDGRIWIVAIRDIESGEEITFNYSYDLEDYKEHPCRVVPQVVSDILSRKNFFQSFKVKPAFEPAWTCRNSAPP